MSDDGRLICTGPECANEPHVGELCQAHYMQKRRGRPLRPLRELANKQTAPISTYVTPEVRRAVVRAAKKSSVTTAEWLRVIVKAALGLALLAGCGGLHTGGDACKSLASTMCNQAQVCSLATKPRAQCEHDVAASCCDSPQMHCGADLTAEQATRNARCIDSIGALSCGDFERYAAGEIQTFGCD